MIISLLKTLSNYKYVLFYLCSLTQYTVVADFAIFTVSLLNGMEKKNQYFDAG